MRAQRRRPLLLHGVSFGGSSSRPKGCGRASTSMAGMSANISAYTKTRGRIQIIKTNQTDISPTIKQSKRIYPLTTKKINQNPLTNRFSRTHEHPNIKPRTKTNTKSRGHGSGRADRMAGPAPMSLRCQRYQVRKKSNFLSHRDRFLL